MSWRILVTARVLFDTAPEAVEQLRRRGCDLMAPPKTGPFSGEALLQLIDGADATIASVDRYTADVFASPQAARLKLISRWGVGFDSIDLAAATAAGVIVAYTPGVLDETVADFAFAQMLGLLRRIPEGDRFMREGEWQKRWGSNLHGKTLGLIGLGRIGQAVARRAAGFNMKILAHDPFPPTAPLPVPVEMVGLEQLLRESDIVSLHAALTSENKGMIGERQLRLMKRTAFLINTARGALVNENALVKALHEKWIAGAAIDAFTTEPLPRDHPLRDAPNTLLTPHQASFTLETGQRVSRLAVQAVLDLMDGRKPKTVVDPSVFASPKLRATLDGE